jgi:hypothetical protein
MLRSYEYVNLADIIAIALLGRPAAGNFHEQPLCAVANDRAILSRKKPGLQARVPTFFSKSDFPPGLTMPQ